VGGLVARYHGLQLRLDPKQGEFWFTYDSGPPPPPSLKLWGTSPPAPVSEPKITIHAPERRRSIEAMVREMLGQK